ncbi:hypothetical protein EAF00_001592 [Botryotinia globosa]|nr:hypothetical protein EAF00_001592 [Botryotinia globosa]
MVYISCGEFMIAKLVDDQSFDPAYTKKQATRLYQICYRKYSRGYVRVGTEKMLYMADKCYWHQFWPDQEFPRENAHVLLNKKEGKATKQNESIAGGMEHNNKQEDARSRQNEAAEMISQHSISNSDKTVKTTNFREGSRPRQNAVTRGRTKAMRDTKAIDWDILTIQRRKEHRRKLKQNLSSKKQAAEASARALSKHSSKASIPSEHPHISQEGVEKAQSASLSTQLQSELSVAGVAATTAHKDSTPLEDSQHSSEIAEDLQLNPSSNRLQTLDEMIEEEKEIASQLIRCVRASCPSPEENRKICQGGNELGAADGGIKEVSNENGFCVIL